MIAALYKNNGRKKKRNYDNRHGQSAKVGGDAVNVFVVILLGHDKMKHRLFGEICKIEQ
ncbi:MAG: hypothetical protein U1C49_03250 [Candidatus Andersenbacteria bacterium]|nr:hypothetical protein [Candidatus Andersenbacteria bacterium]